MPNTSAEIEAQVQELVAKNRISKAIDLLLAHFKEIDDQPRHKAVIKLSARSKIIEKSLQLNEITKEEADVKLSRVMDATLNVFNIDPSHQEDLSAGASSHPHNPVHTDKFGERIVQIASLIILLFLVLGIVASLITQGLDPIIKAIEASLFVIGASMVAFGLLYFVKKHILT